MEDGKIIRFPEPENKDGLTERENRLYLFLIAKFTLNGWPARYTGDGREERLKAEITSTRHIRMDSRRASQLSSLLPGLSPGIVMDIMGGRIHAGS